MLELNKVFLVGNMTRDPEVRMTNTGKQVARLGLAVNRRGWGGGQDETLFIDVTVWEKQAEFAKNYLHKGSAIFVEGRLKMDTWQDKETGANRSRIEVVAERVTFAAPRSDGEGGGGGGGGQRGGYSRGGEQGGGDYDAAPRREQRPPSQPAPSETEDDLPF